MGGVLKGVGLLATAVQKGVPRYPLRTLTVSGSKKEREAATTGTDCTSRSSLVVRALEAPHLSWLPFLAFELDIWGARSCGTLLLHLRSILLL